MIRRQIVIVLLLVSLATLTLPAVGAQTDEGWVHVQNGTQGYALDVPRTAIVQGYGSQDILHVQLPDQRMLTIRSLPNTAQLSAVQWTDAWLSNGQADDAEERDPPLPVISRTAILIGGSPAEIIVRSGLRGLNRRIVIATGEHIYLIDHSLEQIPGEGILDRVVNSFETGFYESSFGFQIVAIDPTHTITALPVPYYSQRSEPWRCDQYGTCTFEPTWHVCPEHYTTIDDAGCHISSQAMIFDYFTGHYKDPGELDTCLTNNNQYFWQSYFQGYCGAPNLSPVCSPSSVSYEGYSPMNDTLLDAELNSGFPVLARKYDDSHSVVVIGKTNGNYRIHDPYDSGNTVVAPGWILGFWKYHGPLPDAIAPTTVASLSGTLGENGWYISDVQVTLNATDNPGGSGVDWIKYKIDDGAWQTRDGNSASFTVSGDARHIVYYYAQDNFGNPESQKSLLIPIDTVAPTGSFTMNNGSTRAYATLVRVNPEAADATSGVWQIRLRDAGGAWGDWMLFQSKLYYLLPAITNQYHAVEMQVRDYAGHESTSYAQSIYLQVHPPRPASINYSVAKSTLGMSGASHRCTDSYCLGNTAAQPSGVSGMSSTNYNLALGYWRLEGSGRRIQPSSIYLPLVSK